MAGSLCARALPTSKEIAICATFPNKRCLVSGSRADTHDHLPTPPVTYVQCNGRGRRIAYLARAYRDIGGRGRPLGAWRPVGRTGTRRSDRAPRRPRVRHLRWRIPPLAPPGKWTGMGGASAWPHSHAREIGSRAVCDRRVSRERGAVQVSRPCSRSVPLFSPVKESFSRKVFGKRSG